MSNDEESPGIATRPIDLLIEPFARFARMEASGGILLLACTFVALVWANSPWESSYNALWDAPITAGFGRFVLTESRKEWINDGLMSIFFFLVGLEIKRELLIGELSSLRQAALPFISAVGGAVVPALIYVIATRGSDVASGWGIPMATDIAFTLGVLTVLGSRVPIALKIFVTALAVVDDIFAVLVIAVFHTRDIQTYSLLVGLGGVAVCFGMNLLGARKPVIYAAIGVIVWFAILKSGIHATIAGVLVAFTVPARTRVDRGYFLSQGRMLLDSFEKTPPDSPASHAAVDALESQCELMESPLQHVERYLHPWVSFLVMPLFALANAGVRIVGNIQPALTSVVTIGVVLGLFVGKPVGIYLFAWLSIKTGMSTLPPHITWGTILGASWLCGIGFTMSLFIATLSLADETSLDMAKIGILAASAAAGLCGSVVLLWLSRK